MAAAIILLHLAVFISDSFSCIPTRSPGDGILGPGGTIGGGTGVESGSSDTTTAATAETTTAATTTTPTTTSTTSTTTTTTTTTSTTTTTTTNPCPTDWYYFAMTNACYYVGGSTLLGIPFVGTWPMANSACQALGAQLASIHSAAENAFIVMISATGLPGVLINQPWIGLMRPIEVLPPYTDYAWSDGTPYDYMPWAPLQPIPDDTLPSPGACAQIISQAVPGFGLAGEWYVSPCIPTPVTTYICKMPL